MKLKSTIIFSVCLIVIVAFSSCSKIKKIMGKGEKSSTTGWTYNDPESGGFEFNSGYKQPIGPGLVFVQGGTFTMGRTQEDLMYEWNNVPRRVTVPSFYIDEFEVRNIDYLEYLYWVKRVHGNTDVYRSVLPDTLVWRDELAYNDPYVNNYLRHPAYAQYPVVGVSWEQAEDYCAWRTDRVNERILIDRGILKEDLTQNGNNNFNTEAYLAGQYQGVPDENSRNLNPNGEPRRVLWTDGILLPKYRLPTEAEWEYAALGLIGNSKDERIGDKRIFPWNGHWVRNENKRYRGQMMANFSRSRGDYMGVAGTLNDGGDITVPVNSFWPNDLGLYCMAGNVNEWVADVYRPMTSEDVSEFNPFRGNVFKVPMRDEQGRLVEKDSLGRIRYRNQTDEEIKERSNYFTADNRSYRDGDMQSSIAPDMNWNNPEHERSGSTQMYFQGGGKNNQRINSLINDDSRVYKGGSWKDRAFWLSPGTRRFLSQKEARNDIGFRCAMSHVGRPDHKKTQK